MTEDISGMSQHERELHDAYRGFHDGDTFIQRAYKQALREYERKIAEGEDPANLVKPTLRNTATYYAGK